MDSAQKTSQGYQPGVCNIGPAEIQKRKEIGIGSALVASGFSFIAAVFHFPLLIKLIVFIPAIIAAVSFVQVYFHFCVAFGLSNVFNLGGVAGKTESIIEKEARELDRRQAWKLIGIATSIAFVYTFISVFIV